MNRTRFFLSVIGLALCAHTTSSSFGSGGFAGVGFLKGYEIESQALGVSKAGTIVVGSSDYHELVPGAHHQGRPFVWSLSGGITELPSLPYDPEKDRGGQANGIDDDGAIITGYSYFAQSDPNDPGFNAVLWREPFDASEAEQLQNPSGYLYSRAVSVSSHNSPVVVGYCMNTTSGSTNFRRGCYWSGPFPMTVTLLDVTIPDADPETSWPVKVSASGETIVGSVVVSTDGNRVPIVWKRTGGIFVAGLLPLPPGRVRGLVSDVSVAGNVIVGSVAGPDGKLKPCRWSSSGGTYAPIEIPNLPPGDIGTAQVVSAEGNVIVGYVSDKTPEGFFPTTWVWSTVHGTRTLVDALEAESVTTHADWSNLQPWDISPDGHTIVGMGLNPGGHEEGWVAMLKDP